MEKSFFFSSKVPIFLSITNITSYKLGFDSLHNIKQDKIRVRFPNLKLNAGSIPAFIKTKIILKKIIKSKRAVTFI